jgi:transcription elongation factor GreB
MSRGFVKEDDQEEAPIIPPRAALPNGVTNYVTPNGLEELKLELKDLEKEQANLTIKDDQERRRAIAVITAKMNQLKERLASARLLDPKDQPKDEVRFGATVKLKNITSNLVQEFQIVGVDEANIKKQKIAFVAPLVTAIIGATTNETVSFILGGEVRELMILSISY